jgi:hypothetical protein
LSENFSGTNCLWFAIYYTQIPYEIFRKHPERWYVPGNFAKYPDTLATVGKFWKYTVITGV